ncbi:MAG: methyltransferase domain-containing protein [bacterium]|nr:methyltransferase domain-containing protein [bacterium]
MLRIFLSHAMDGVSEAHIQASEQRYRQLLAYHDFELVNPYSASSAAQPFLTAESVGRSDMAQLESAHVVIADLSLPHYTYVGAIFEIALAAQRGTPVVAVVGESPIRNRLYLLDNCQFVCERPEDAVDFCYRSLTERGRESQIHETVSYYGSIASEYGTARRRTHTKKELVQDSYAQEREQIRAQLDQFSVDATAIQVGIGTGDWTRSILQAPCRSVVGLDLSTQMIAEAKRRMSDSRFTALQGDGRAIPFDDMSFDFAAALFVIGLQPPAGQTQLAAELVRTTRLGGNVMLCDTRIPNRYPSEGLGRTRIETRPGTDRDWRIMKTYVTENYLDGLLGNSIQIVSSSERTRGNREDRTWFAWVVGRKVAP